MIRFFLTARQLSRKTEFRKKFALPCKFRTGEKNFLVEYEELVDKYKPLNLAIGFPNFLPPQYVRDAFIDVACTSRNEIYQYSRGPGHLRLVTALSKLYSKLISREINPLTEIVVSLGGYHALFLSIQGLVDQSDEVIIIEPFFEPFIHFVQSAGGILRCTPLKLCQSTEPSTSDDWILDYDHLESLFNEKTKVIILNTPHNPTGKIFSYEELSFIAELCQKWDVVCLSDQVYEFLIFDSKKLVRMSNLPEMWDRTVTISSAGKIFGVTGFKLGWIYGPDYLMANLREVKHQNVRTGNTFVQEVVAICIERELSRLGSEESYFVSLAKEIERKRDFMGQFLTEVGMRPIFSSAGYFMLADWTLLGKSIDLSKEEDEYKDNKFTKWMVKNVGILGTPVTAFFTEEHKYLGESFVRYCYVKSDDYLKKAEQLLKDLRRKLSKN